MPTKFFYLSVLQLLQLLSARPSAISTSGPMMLSQFDQLKVVDSTNHLDCPRLVDILANTSTSTFNFLLWGSDGAQYVDFVACLQHTSGLVVDGRPVTNLFV